MVRGFLKCFRAQDLGVPEGFTALWGASLGWSSGFRGLRVRAFRVSGFGSFRKLGVPDFGVPIIRILLFRVLC